MKVWTSLIKRIPFSFLIVVACCFSCDDDTAFIGTDIMPGNDDVSTSHSEFVVKTRSIKIDSVLANTNDCYLGSIIDPETRAMTTSGFLAQFHLMENYSYPAWDKMLKDDDGQVFADSCDIRIAFEQYYGDSLKPMKLYVEELDTARVMEENVSYYTNIDPNDYVCKNGGLRTSLVYTVRDLTRPDSETDETRYYRSVVVRLPASYGSYIMRKFYENPDYFRNSYQFIHHVCPGFYFHTEGSVGSMINAKVSTLNVYFRYHTLNEAGKDTIVDGLHRVASTEEVIQNTRVENKLPDGMLDESKAYTYVKSPTGIFTEVELPVSDIVAGSHYNDTINSAKIVFRAYQLGDNELSLLSPPADMLMVRKKERDSFFENNKLPDSKESYLTSYSSSMSSYVYSNIGQMITIMKLERDKGAGVLPSDSEAERSAKYAVWEQNNPDWNKVILIPVKAEYMTKTDSYGYVTKTLLQVRHSMGLNSIRLEGGNSASLKMSVIYSRFSKK